MPDDADVDVHREWLLIQLRIDVDGRRHDLPGGLAARADFDAFLAGERELDVLFEPTRAPSLAGYALDRAPPHPVTCSTTCRAGSRC